MVGSLFFVVSGIIALIIAAKFVWPDPARHRLVADLRAAAAAARQRDALRLAAGRRHGAVLLPRAAAVRRQAVEREARARHRGALECDHPGRGGRAARRATTRGWSTRSCRCRSTCWWWWPGSCSASNIFATIATRKYQQMYVSLWYIMGTILWTAFVYLTGNFAALFATGVNQANLNWMYVHNAVGLIFTPVGLGHRLLLHPEGVEHAALQPQAVDDRLLVAGLRLRLDGRAPHAARADLAVAADHRHRLLGDAADPGLGAWSTTSSPP